MSVTQTITKNDVDFVEISEGEWEHRKNFAHGYHSFNDAGLECEVGEFLHGLIRATQPDNVLETGTHFGVGALYMAYALQDNHKGHLDTIEFLPEIHKKAYARMVLHKLDHIVTCHLMDVKDFIPTVMYKVILLDTEPQTRFQELIKFEPFLEQGGFLFIHDLHQHMNQVDNAEHGFAWPYGKIPEKMKQLVQTGVLRPFHFSTPRGLTGFYKVHENDYIWER